MGRPVKGRFAPTPSGRMHLGNALCMLLAWLSARAAGGGVLLRIEDPDTLRAPREYAGLIESDLLWLGLDWDEGGSRGGPAAPYYQSERSALYEQALAALRERGLTYPCFCSRADLHAADAPHRADGRFVYPGACRGLAPEEAARRARLRPPAVRVRVPDETVAFTDLHYGPRSLHLGRDCGDFILRRSDGVFSYQLAVVVDDALMGVTQVVRGEDLLDSAPPQIWLHRALGYEPPEFGHLPLLLAADGRRLSKRDQDLDLGRLRQRLRSPEPLIGLLAHLCGLLDRPEPAAARELAPLFSWAKVPRHDLYLPPGAPERLWGAG